MREQLLRLSSVIEGNDRAKDQFETDTSAGQPNEVCRIVRRRRAGEFSRGRAIRQVPTQRWTSTGPISISSLELSAGDILRPLE